MKIERDDIERDKLIKDGKKMEINEIIKETDRINGNLKLKS